MTVIQDGMFGTTAYYCERCGRSLSNKISMLAHKGPVCRAKSGAKEMGKEDQIDMRKWGARFEYKGYGGCACHCYVKVNGNIVICTEAPDNEGTSITNLAEHVAETVAIAYGIKLDQLVWVEHYTREKGSDLPETFDRVEFDIIGGKFHNPRWSNIDDNDEVIQWLAR